MPAASMAFEVATSRPVTPFHFGPGILLKSWTPRAVSLTAFVVSQIVIDTESGYHLLRGDWPVHREGHSLLAGSLIGLLSGTSVWLAGQRRRRIAASLDRLHARLISWPLWPMQFL